MMLIIIFIIVIIIIIIVIIIVIIILIIIFFYYYHYHYYKLTGNGVKVTHVWEFDKFREIKVDGGCLIIKIQPNYPFITASRTEKMGIKVTLFVKTKYIFVFMASMALLYGLNF